MAKLYVGNLPFNIDDVSLGEWVVAAGFQVQTARVIMDRQTARSRGFGFVELVRDEDVARAIEVLNGQQLGGRTVQVNEARPERPRGGEGGGRGERRPPRW
jgi:cold-inducible RNA-binding protein